MTPFPRYAGENTFAFWLRLYAEAITPYPGNGGTMYSDKGRT